MNVGFYETRDRVDSESNRGIHSQISYDVEFDASSGDCTIFVSTTSSYADGRIEKTKSLYAGKLTLVTL